MSKIYGYKEKDVKELYEFLKGNGNKSLTEIFRLFGEKQGKSKGTVRNLYYAMAKKSREDENFRREFAGGEVLSVKQNEKFDNAEEKELIDKILALKEKGKSVRSAVNYLSGGDAKLALRYQNKYRSVMAKDKILNVRSRGAKALLKKIRGIDEIESANFSEEKLIALKARINALYDRLFSGLKKENEYLKNKVVQLEKERFSYLNANGAGIIELYKTEGEDKLVN